MTGRVDAVWSSFDHWRNAKSSEGANDAAEAEAAATNEPELFGAGCGGGVISCQSACAPIE